MAFTHTRTGAQLEASLDAADAAVEHDDATTLTVTVGSGGDYSTINAALTALRAKVRGYTNGGRATTISLLTGFTMSEQVICDHGVDLSWITITSVDAEVPIARSAITEQTTGLGDGFESTGAYRAAFMGGGSARMPTLGCKMAMDTSGVANDQSGIFLTNGAEMRVLPSAGIDDTDANGAHVMLGARLYATGSTWDGNGRVGVVGDAKAAVRCDWGGFAALAEAVITNQGYTGVTILGASRATLRDASITTCGEDGLETGGVSIVHARGLSISSAARYGLFAAEGSRVRLLSNTFANNNTGIRAAGGALVDSDSGTSITGSTNYGVHADGLAKVHLVAPTVTGSGIYNIRSEKGAEVFISAGGSGITGGGTKDLFVNFGGRIHLSGTVATTAGNTLANNLADSNVAVFGVMDSEGGMIYGRGGAVRGKGTATITSGTTSVTVTHGVDDEYVLQLQEISVIPTNATAAALDWYVTNVTTTQFDIACAVAPGASATFAWHAEKVVL